jgi:chromosome segregation ATPase
LRLAIERSTLLGSRTQLAISRLQLQQNAAAQAARDLDNLRRDVAEMSARRSTIEKEMKNAEEEANSAKPEARTAIQQAIAQLKLNLEAISGEIDRGAAREAELNRKVGELQAQVSDAESRIGQMERSLDEAIQQMLKPR